MIRTPLFLAALAGGALCAQAVPARPESIRFKPLAFAAPRTAAFKVRLDNGITAYLAGDPNGTPLVKLQVLIRGGAYMDPKGREGLAKLTGMLMRDGGTLDTPAQALDERLEFLAGNINASLGDTWGRVDMAFLEKDFKEGLDLFMQVLSRPAFDPDRLAQAKQEQLQGLMARCDETGEIARIEFPRLLHGEDHFSSACMTGASLEAITREDLAAFHARILHPGNLVVSVSGRFGREAMVAMLNKTLGALSPGGSATVSPGVPGPAREARPGIYVVDKDVPQAHVEFSLPGLRRTDPDWYAALVLNQVLGGSGFTSRLMRKIRSDEGLTYGIGTSLGEGAHWKGRLGGSLQTKNRSVAYALRLILAEMERLRNDPLEAEELTVIKDSIVQAFPSRWGRKADVISTFAREQLTGWPEDWWADYRERIQAVSAQEVLRAARKYLVPSRLVILVVGNAGEMQAGDAADHPGLLKDAAPLPVVNLPKRDPISLKPLS